MISVLPSNPLVILLGPTVREDINKSTKVFNGRFNPFSLIEKYGAKRIADKRIANLSEGELRLTAALSCIALDTKVVLMDEPTVGLDKEYRERLISVIKDIASEKIVIVATNDIRLAAHADNIIALDNGKVISKGNPKEIFYSLNTQWFYSPIIEFVKKLNDLGLKNERPVTSVELKDLLRELINGF